MSKLNDVSNAALRDLLGTFSFGKHTLAATAGAATYTTTQSPAASAGIVIDGKPSLFANLAAKVVATLAALQQPITGLNGYYVQPAGTTVYYVVVTDGTNTYVIQGTYAGQVFTPFRQQLGTGDVPDVAVKSTYAVLGIIKVVTAGAATFTPATTFWDAASVTSTAFDYHRLPSVNP